MAWHELNGVIGSKQQGKAASNELAAAGAVDREVSELTRCDARSIWARASDFRGFATALGGTGGRKRIPVAVEVERNASDADREALARRIQLRGIYGPPATGGNFWTGVVYADALAKLSKLKAVKGWRIGLENIPGVERTQAPVPPGDGTLEGFLHVPPLVGIIDHGLGIAHRAFRYPNSPATPRLISLWDQEPERCLKPNNPHKYWQELPGIGYGGELSHETLKRLIADSGGRDRWIYEQLRYEPALTRVSHGTHVLDLAAGWPNPLANSAALPNAETVSRSPIVAVQLPYKPARDASGSALCVHVLDALHYIVGKALKRQRVVINLSDGAYGGAHDGMSMLERAIDEFLEKRPWVNLVLAAGNAHEMRGHARVEALQLGSIAPFDWRVLPDDYTDSYSEVWFDCVCCDGSVALTLTPPGGLDPVTVPMGSTQLLLDADGNVLGSVISRSTSPDGPARSMFLVAVASTGSRNRGRPAAPHGLWQVRVQNISVSSGVAVDAWIERDNPVINESGPRRQSFFEDRHCHPLVVDGQGTLGSLAGSGQAIVVGGRYRRGAASGGCDASKLSSVARYSSRGPSRAGPVQGPDLLAPSDDSPVQHGLLAAANRAGAKFRMDGTSVAAPIVTRRIVNLLGSADPPASNRDAMMAALIGPNPGPDPDLTGERGSVEPGSEPPPALGLWLPVASLR